MANADAEFRRSDRAGVRDAVAALLRLPFAKALELSIKLQQHIQGQEFRESVEQEFIEAWGANHDEFLVSVLLDIISEEDDSTIMTILASSALLPAHGVQSVSLYEKEQVEDEDIATQSSTNPLMIKAQSVRHFMDQPMHGTIEWGGWLPGEAAAPPSESVEDLLRMPFGDALNLSKELREYLADVEDGQKVEDEFRQAWGPHAPEDLKATLSQIVSPDLKLVGDKTSSLECNGTMRQGNGSLNLPIVFPKSISKL